MTLFVLDEEICQNIQNIKIITMAFSRETGKKWSQKGWIDSDSLQVPQNIILTSVSISSIFLQPPHQKSSLVKKSPFAMSMLKKINQNLLLRNSKFWFCLHLHCRKGDLLTKKDFRHEKHCQILEIFFLVFYPSKNMLWL